MQGRVMKCVEMIQKVGMVDEEGGAGGSAAAAEAEAEGASVPQSPVGVLDAACWSYKSDDLTTVGSCANSEAKRRKLEINTI